MNGLQGIMMIYFGFVERLVKSIMLMTCSKCVLNNSLHIKNLMNSQRNRGNPFPPIGKEQLVQFKFKICDTIQEIQVQRD